MLKGAHRVIDILTAIPEIKSRITAREYMDIIGERWAGRQSNNEEERQRLISEKREIMREAYTIIFDADKTLETVGRFIPNKDSSKSTDEQCHAQEIIADGAYANKIKALKTVLDAQSGIAKLLGLEVKKVEHSGGINILEERRATIALLGASAGQNTLREFLRGIDPADEERHRSICSEPAAVALPSGESPGSQTG